VDSCKHERYRAGESVLSRIGRDAFHEPTPPFKPFQSFCDIIAVTKLPERLQLGRFHRCLTRFLLKIGDQLFLEASGRGVRHRCSEHGGDEVLSQPI